MLIIEVLDHHGAPPTEAAISAVRHNAHDMIKSRHGKLVLRTEGMYLNIRTEFEEITLDDQSGIQFRINYREKGGSGSARLIVMRKKAPSATEAGENRDHRGAAASRSAPKQRWVN